MASAYSFPLLPSCCRPYTDQLLLHSVVDWWYSLAGDLRKAQTWGDLLTLWRMTMWGRNITGWGVYGLEKIGLVPKGTWDVQESLKIAGAYDFPRFSTSLWFLPFSFSSPVLTLPLYSQPTLSSPVRVRTSSRR